MKPIAYSVLGLCAFFLNAHAAPPAKDPESIANINQLIEENGPSGTISWNKELTLENGKIGMPSFDDEGRRRTQEMPLVRIMTYTGNPAKIVKKKQDLAALQKEFSEKCDVGLKFWKKSETCPDLASKMKQTENDIIGTEHELKRTAASCDLGVPSSSSSKVILPAGKARYRTEMVSSTSRRFGPSTMPKIIVTLKTDKGEREGLLSCSFGWSDWAEAQAELSKAGFTISPDVQPKGKPDKGEYIRLEGAPERSDDADDSGGSGNHSAD